MAQPRAKKQNYSRSTSTAGAISGSFIGSLPALVSGGFNPTATFAAGAAGAGAGYLVGKKYDEKYEKLPAAKKTAKEEKKIEKELLENPKDLQKVTHAASLAGFGVYVAPLVKHYAPESKFTRPGSRWAHANDSNVTGLKQGKIPKPANKVGVQYGHGGISFAAKYKDRSSNAESEFSSRVRAVQFVPKRGALLKKITAEPFIKDQLGLGVEGHTVGMANNHIHATGTRIEFDPLKTALVVGAGAAVTGGGVYAYKHREEIKDRVHHFAERHPIRVP